MITKQNKVLRFIRDYIKKKGYSPTNDEIKEAVGIKSKPMVNHYLNQLELQGKIIRNKYKHRNIILKKKDIKEETAQKKLKNIRKDLVALSTLLCFPDEDMKEQIMMAYRWTNEMIEVIDNEICMQE